MRRSVLLTGLALLPAVLSVPADAQWRRGYGGYHGGYGYRGGYGRRGLGVGGALLGGLAAGAVIGGLAARPYGPGYGYGYGGYPYGYAPPPVVYAPPPVVYAPPPGYYSGY